MIYGRVVVMLSDLWACGGDVLPPRDRLQVTSADFARHQLPTTLLGVLIRVRGSNTRMATIWAVDA